jgi:hypothetical protein
MAVNGYIHKNNFENFAFGIFFCIFAPRFE